ncbi:MAG: methyltransferase [Dehalococcoidia bacterium]
MTSTAIPSPETMFDFVVHYGSAQVVHVAAQLGLADLLADGPRRIEELAAATSTHAPSLARLLRMLAALGIIAEDSDGRISLTAYGTPLRRGVPGSVRDRVLFLAGDWYWRSWGELLYSVRTGEPAFDHVFGTSNFAYWEREPEVGAIHDAFFSETARTVTPSLVAAYDYSRFGTIADIGGNEGPLLAAILMANPGLRGILFDLPHVVAGAPAVLAAAGVADRCMIVGGDFFTAVPAGADVYLLKYIIHDWDDERALSILRRCRAAMDVGATLLLIEQLLPERFETGKAAVPAARVDLLMLVLSPGGRERTVAQFRGLLAAAGFALQQVIPTGSPFFILEAAAT